MRSISVAELSSGLGQAHPPVLVDVRRSSARLASGLTLAQAIWRDPALWLDWKDELAAMPGPLVFFCVHGHEVSQAMTAALCAMGKDASYLEGGFAQWQKADQPVVPLADRPPSHA